MMKRHSAEEIATKLRQAEELMARGQSQAQACKALGVSVMTFHRWRKLHLTVDGDDGLVAAEAHEIAGRAHMLGRHARGLSKRERVENILSC